MKPNQFSIVIGAGLAGSFFLAGLYLGLVSWAESFQHAVEFFWQDRWIVLPVILGFGMQVALYVVLKKRLFIPHASTASSGANGLMTGASGATSSVAMAACCAHHVTDVLPVLGLTAAATFLAEYRVAFMLVGLAMTLVGVMVMLVIFFRERRNALQITSVLKVTEA